MSHHLPPDVSDWQPTDLELIATIIDTIFWGGAFWETVDRFIRHNTKGEKSKWRFEVWPPNPAVDQNTGAAATGWGYTGLESSVLDVYMAAAEDGGGDCRVVANDGHAIHKKAHWVLHVMAHEMIHVLHGILKCGTLLGHCALFQCYNNRMYNSTNFHWAVVVVGGGGLTHHITHAATHNPYSCATSSNGGIPCETAASTNTRFT